MNSEASPLSEQELENRMRPGVLSEKGFLGENERLDDVLARDKRTITGLGVTCAELAEKLEVLIKAAENAPNHTARIGQYKVKVKIYPGFQMCPWSIDIHSSQCTAGGGVRFASLDWNIRDLSSSREMNGPGLAVHLIRDHHFFEGFESPYRVDPSELAQLLGLGPFGK